MTKHFCDRCKKESPIKRYDLQRLEASCFNSQRTIELCKECESDLTKCLDTFINEKKMSQEELRQYYMDKAAQNAKTNPST